MTFIKQINTLNAALAPFPGGGEFDPIFANEDLETVTVGLGESVLSLFAPFAFLTNGFADVTLNNSGNITSISSDGVIGDGEGFTLVNTSTGYIAAQSFGVVLVGGDASATNAGTIIAGAVGIGAISGDATVLNTGTIIADSVGILVSSFGGGPLSPTGMMLPASTTVTNEGFIASQAIGVEIEASAVGTVLNNSGEIIGQQTGVSVEAHNTTINNSGSITGDTAIYVDGTTTVVNSAGGYIASESIFGPGLPLGFYAGAFGNAIFGDEFGTLNLTNDGDIFGHVNLLFSTTDDVIVNNGVSVGDVIMGGGNDMFTAGAGSKVMGNPIFEESFTSEAVSTGGGIFGGSGNDTIYGHSQGEVIYGDADEDYIKGRGGNDYLDGGSENDRLVAGSGNDTLNGGAGDDRLVGNQGNNIMIGGEGADRMRAGSGIDTFVWHSDTESGIDSATSDVILMFEVGVDKLDFQATVDGQLYFSALGDVGVVGEGYLFVTDNGTDSFVSVDVEGDGVIDMVVELKDTLGLTVNDFLGASEELFLP